MLEKVVAVWFFILNVLKIYEWVNKAKHNADLFFFLVA